uniref:Uncharacterized protein n=1 Tax=Arundo donax TaxID=35708 RepID=A0A0A9C056_ARUDO
MGICRAPMLNYFREQNSALRCCELLEFSCSVRLMLH